MYGEMNEEDPPQQGGGPVAPQGNPCPRDQTHMEPVEEQGASFLGCPRCRGVFVSEEDLENYVGVVGGAEAGDAFGRLFLEAVMDAGGTGKRLCPYCSEPLRRHGFGRNPFLVIDRCEEHGIWLDNNEVQRIIQSARAAANL